LEAGVDQVVEIEAERREGLGQMAYRRFKEALFDRRIDPGAFLSQGDLVRLLDVPLAPLREALQRLQAEGLVTIKARAGIEISKPDIVLVRNTYQLRLILERAAVRRFAETATMDLIEDLERRHVATIEGVRGREVSRDEARRIEALDGDFHRTVIDCLGNPLVGRAYAQTYDYIQFIRIDRHYGLSAPLVLRTMTEHLDIIAAYKARDADRAEEALETHFARAMQRAMGL
jgi:DNA-binding GntR family transcriptional regulator